MRTITQVVYSFDELSTSAQERAITLLSDINVDYYYEWWKSIYEDAESVGIKITSFDLDRNRHATVDISDCKETAYLIIDNHGQSCETYKTSTAFIEEYDAAVDNFPLDEDGDRDDYELDKILDKIEREFRQSITEDYSIILQEEYEYLCSEEAIRETIELNDYKFTEEGEMI